MAGGIIALILFATLLGSGVYMRVRTWIDHGPLADGELGDFPYLPQGFGTAKRGREAATAPKADNANHVAGL
jgi:hypothetical protein